jgi:hypothetical protein
MEGIPLITADREIRNFSRAFYNLVSERVKKPLTAKGAKNCRNVRE